MRSPRAPLAVLVLAGAMVACGGGGGHDAASPNASLTVPLAVKTLDLPNGLHVLFDEDHRSPLVAVNVSYHVGSKDDPRGRSGTAHLFEHLMFDGSAHVAKGEFASYLDAAGARAHNATTWRDRTAYWEVLPSNQLDLALWLESDRMGFALDKVDQAELDRERNVVKNEADERNEHVDAGYEARFVYGTLFPEGHPYHQPFDPNAELDAISLDDLRAFYGAFYVPGNATIAIVGDMRPEEAAASIKKYFATIASRPAPAAARNTPRPSPLTSEKRITIEADVPDAKLVVAWPAPPRFTADAAKLDVAMNTVGNRVDYWLVREHDWAKNVGWGCSHLELASVCQVVVTLTPSAAIKDVLGVIDTAVSDAKQAEAPRRWVARAVNFEMRDLLFSFEQLSDRADDYTLFREATGNPVFLGRWLRTYEGIERADSEAAKQRYLASKGRVVALVKPTPGAPTAGRMGGGTW